MTTIALCTSRRRANNNLIFRPGPTHTGLYHHRNRLEARNFRFKKKSDCTKCVAKIKALISFAVTAKLVCAFVFAYAKFVGFSELLECL